MGKRSNGAANLELAHHFLKLRGVAGDDDDVGTLFCQLARRGAAQTL